MGKEKKKKPKNHVSEAQNVMSVIEENGPGITLTTKMEALKTKVLSLTLELKEAKNEIDQLQQEIFDLKENLFH
uniref:Uncharacterized protein n=1 Tax=Rhodnius prolixus TaxID=13249 RepID=T1I390_RHOPR